MCVCIDYSLFLRMEAIRDALIKLCGSAGHVEKVNLCSSHAATILYLLVVALLCLSSKVTNFNLQSSQLRIIFVQTMQYATSTNTQGLPKGYCWDSLFDAWYTEFKQDELRTNIPQHVALGRNGIRGARHQQRRKQKWGSSTPTCHSRSLKTTYRSWLATSSNNHHRHRHLRTNHLLRLVLLLPRLPFLLPFLRRRRLLRHQHQHLISSKCKRE